MGDRRSTLTISFPTAIRSRPMLSRVADSIYWMSRYVERAENLARFVDVTHHMSLDFPPGSEQQWGALVSASGDQAYFEKHYGEPTRENVMQFLTLDSDYSGSILSCVRAARENARSVRESISSEMWEQLNQFYITVRDAQKLGRLRVAERVLSVR